MMEHYNFETILLKLVRVGLVLLILAGEDCQVKSLHCHRCISHSDHVINSEKYIKSTNDYKINCNINNSLNSDKLEITGTLDIFLG